MVDNSQCNDMYKISVSLESQKININLENKNDCNEQYENNYSFESLVEKQIKLVSCNSIDIIFSLINASIKEKKYSISDNENKEILNISFLIKNAFDNSDIPLNLNVKKNKNEIELLKKNMKELINEVKMLRKENEELKTKINNNVVLLVPCEHSQWDKSCPYCGSKDLSKQFSLVYESYHSGVSGKYDKFYLHHFCNSCKKRFFAPDNGNWKD